MIRTGRCLCGAIQLKAEGEPRLVGNCYCEDCKRETGSGHTVWLVYPRDAVTIEGEAKTFSKLGGSGQTLTRTFCPNCGTTMFGEPDSFGDIRAVRAGTLNNSSGVNPTVSVFVSRACTWDKPPTDIQSFPEALPGE